MTQEQLNFTDPSTVLDQTFDFPPQAEDFPAHLRPALEAYEAANDQAEDLHAAALHAKSTLDSARQRDIDAIESAFASGEEPPELEHTERAQRANDSATAQFRAYQRLHKREARKLFKLLTAESDAIAAHVHGNVSAALTDFQRVLTGSINAIDEAARRVESEGAMINFVEELRRGERMHIGPGQISFPRPETAASHNAATALRNRLNALAEPAQSAYVYVVGANGIVHRWTDSDQVRALLSRGDLRRASPEEIDAYEKARGH